jgi:hypothetical protein
VVSFDRASAERRRFPALDPEPPPPPWWRRLVIPAAVLVLAAAVVAVLQFRPFWPAARGPAGNSARLAGLAGRIVAVTAAGGLVLSDPDGAHVTRAMGNVGEMVTGAPDNRSLALLNGQVITVRHGPALALASSSVPLSSETTTAWPDPFADHERAIVMLQDFGAQSQSSSNPISVVSLATGRAVSLGVGDQVAGDPQAAGAFVSVVAPPSPTAVSVPGSAEPDSEIVLRDAGRPPVLLATAATLNSDLGYARSLPASLDPVPSPSGSEVAVAVRPQGASVTGIVILNRTGQILGRALTPFGTQSIPAWSPSGRSLAYLAGVDGGGTPELRIWTIGRPAVTSVLPGSVLPASAQSTAGTGYGVCIWSPDGMSVLCGVGGGWAIAKAAGGRMAAVHGPGSPVAWLPAPGSP